MKRQRKPSREELQTAAELDRLTAALRDKSPHADREARAFLRRLARLGSRRLIREVYAAIADWLSR